ncbi:hypothetical protein MKW92_048234, partial [Papaver armeniacum]
FQDIAFAPSPFSTLPVDPSTEILLNWTATLTNLSCYRIVGSDETVCRFKTTVEFYNLTSGESVSGGKSAAAREEVPSICVPMLFHVFVWLSLFN